MLQIAAAVRLDGEVEDGRTHPLRGGVETFGGEEVDVYLKVPDGRHLAVEGLMNEYLAAEVLREFGLPTPRAFVVTIDPEFVASIPSAEHRARLALCPAVFALADLGTNWRKWDATERVDASLRPAALQVLAFDGFVGNSDRSPIRPNLMTSLAGGSISMIDHEGAFGMRMKFAPPVVPWQVGNLDLLSRRGAESEHLFFAALAGQQLDFDAVRTTWARLTDDRLNAYAAGLPAPWESARPALDDALRHLGAVRDRMQECLQELQRLLA